MSMMPLSVYTNCRAETHREEFQGPFPVVWIPVHAEELDLKIGTSWQGMGPQLCILLQCPQTSP